MKRWLGSLVIALLLALVWVLPTTPMGRRGTDALPRSDVDSAVLRVDAMMPDLVLTTIDGTRLRVADFRGKRILITFERSVDW